MSGRIKAIPPMQGIPPTVVNVLEAVAHNVDVITGRRGGKIQPVDVATATSVDLALKINELIEKLQE